MCGVPFCENVLANVIFRKGFSQMLLFKCSFREKCFSVLVIYMILVRFCVMLAGPVQFTLSGTPETDVQSEAIAAEIYISDISDPSTEQLRMYQVESQVEQLLTFPRRSRINLDLWKQPWESLDESLFNEEALGVTDLELEPLMVVGSTGVYQVIPSVGQMHLTPLVLVYRQYCKGAGGLNMAGFDYWFLEYLQGSSGLVPQVLDISDPVFRMDLVEKFTSFQAANVGGKLLIETCTHPGTMPEIRYLLMERLSGESIEQFALDTSPQSIAQTMELGVRMIRALQDLHQHNVIHGDAHSGNFILPGVTDEPSLRHGLKLIDFEQARLFNRMDYEGDFCDDPAFISSLPLARIQTEMLNSPWEGRGCIKSFRDDIHRVFLSLATMIHGEAYSIYFSALSKKTGQSPALIQLLSKVWTHHRDRGQIFEVKGFVEFSKQMGIRLPNFPLESHFSLRPLVKNVQALETVRRLFKSLEQQVIDMKITDRPDYDGIVNTFVEIGNQVQTKPPKFPDTRRTRRNL